jgi:hypothetical protein
MWPPLTFTLSTQAIFFINNFSLPDSYLLGEMKKSISELRVCIIQIAILPVIG